jgi:hypothetical protein
VVEIAPQPIEFPNDEGISRLKSFETGIKSRALLDFA